MLSTCPALLPSGIMPTPNQGPWAVGWAKESQDSSTAGPASQLAQGTHITPQERTQRENKASGVISLLWRNRCQATHGADCKPAAARAPPRVIRQMLQLMGRRGLSPALGSPSPWHTGSAQ